MQRGCEAGEAATPELSPQMMMMPCISTVLTETKICLPLYTHWLLPALKKARVKMLLSCPLWCLDISFSPLVDLVLHLATTSPPP